MRKMIWMLGATALLATACTDAPVSTPRGVSSAARAAEVVPDNGVISQSNTSGDAACIAGEWHWVINGLANASLAPASITVNFSSGQVQVPFEKFTGGTAHYRWTSNLTDTLVDPPPTAVLAPGTFYLRFNLSHRPCDDGPKPQGASVVTVVHLAGETTPHTPVTDSLPLGSSVHDNATVTTSDQSSTPAGSTVKFYFWKNNNCTGTPDFSSEEFAAVGTSGLEVDNGLPQGPLGYGGYSYKAFFSSGDITKVSDSEGECEPFAVKKGTLHISTKPHTDSHAEITSAGVALGSKVHDVAFVTGEVAGFPKSNSVAFTFYTDGSCKPENGSAVNHASPDTDGSGVKSVESAALTAGSYGYTASLAGDANYNVVDDTGCEPVKVNKGTLHISTTPHDASHTAITSAGVTLGSKVHDVAFVTGEVAGIPKANAVAFKFYTDGACTPENGSAIAHANPDADGTGVKSVESAALGVGSYGYTASLAGDANYDVIDDTGCESVKINKGLLHISTTPHTAAHAAITSAGVALGSKIHDVAFVSGEVTGFPKANAVTFTFYTDYACTLAKGSAVAKANPDADGTGVKSVESAALAAGGYGYRASLVGDANYDVVDDTGCEPVTVNKAELHVTTKVHDPLHAEITGSSVVAGTQIHDVAFVTGEVTGFPKTTAVVFKFYSNGTCANTGSTLANAGADGTGVKSANTSALAAGAYSFAVTLAGDANYTVVIDDVCESFGIFAAGKTQGFWGNTNGILRIKANGDYSGNSVDIGRGGVINDSTEAAKVFPKGSSGNACGKGNPLIFTGVGGETTSADCTFAAGINVGTLNTAASQSLALGYNLLLVGGFPNHNMAQFQCAVPAGISSLVLSTTSVNALPGIAKALIDGSIPGGSTTQTQLGALNTLLGCINKEA